MSGARDGGTAGRRVVVVGGGYGGATVAKKLDPGFDVTLVEPKDAFMHNVAALRALVDPDWLPRIFFPYTRLLDRGRVLQDRAVEVGAHHVTTAGGHRLEADFIVLATGSTYPFPAKTDLVHAADSKARILAVHRALERAHRVVLFGAGPVGIELAGEIRHRWPLKPVRLVGSAPVLLNGPYRQDLREELARQLREAGVEILLGTHLDAEPVTPPGDLGDFEVTSREGTVITGDIWFRCHGVAPTSDYLDAELASALLPDGRIDVVPSLQVVGQERVFALGDLSSADGNMAGIATRQAPVVAANVAALAAGSTPVAIYRAAATSIAIPLGPAGGAGQLAGRTALLDADTVATLKGEHMMTAQYAELFSHAPQAG